MSDQPARRPGRRRSKQQIVEVLHRAGYPEAADVALQTLPDEVDHDHLERFCRQQGIFPSDLISRMGGSP